MENAIIQAWKDLTDVTRPIEEIPSYFKEVFELGWKAFEYQFIGDCDE